MGRPCAFLLDDDQDFLHLFSRMLSNQGVESKCFREISPFLSEIRDVKPKICFLDLNINQPGDGFSVIESLTNSMTRSPPIFIVSSSSDVNSLSHAISMGASNFIVKPFTRDVLERKMSRFFNSIDSDRDNISKNTEILEADLDVVAIDEKGMILAGPSYLSEGQVLSLKADLLEKITGTDRRHPVTVTHSDPEPQAGRFIYRASFDPADSDTLNSVQRWLTIRGK